MPEGTAPVPPATAGPPLPDGLPVDILHLSDLHWGAKADGSDSLDHCWQTFLDHVTKCLQKEWFKPEFIVFTGDLVETPVPRRLEDFRRGVNALLELAHRCALTGAEPPPTWKECEPVPPPVWWELLGRRIFVVPGNHDFYWRGLRKFWKRWTHHWAALSVSPGETVARTAAASGPLAFLLLDSNGGRRFWSYARGEVEQQASLSWPAGIGVSPRSFRVALMHGHPLQVPYLLTQLDSEQLMLVENAGLLLKNLTNLQVRLVLHGHRHYPNISALSLPDSEGTMQPLVVVGAGSLTRPPDGWKYCSYNWIRIHPDRRVEVTIEQRARGETTFSIAGGKTYLADAGDFRYDSIHREVTVHERTGDFDVKISIRGFRVLPCRAPVDRIPFAIQREPFSSLAAWSFREIREDGSKSHVEWHETTSLVLEPPQTWQDPPRNLELRYFMHNGEALSDWEAGELYGDVPGMERGTTSLRVTCATGAIELAVALPSAFRQTARGDFRGNVLRGDDRLDEEGSQRFEERIEWSSERCQVRARRERPEAARRYELSWAHPRSPRMEREVGRKVLLIRRWQDSLLREHERDNRPFDAKCGEIAKSLQGMGLPPDTDVSLFVPDTNDLRRARQQPLRNGALRLVGATMSLAAPLSRWSLPFGVGVAGRAWRSATPQLYHVSDATASREAYEGGGAEPPENFYHSFLGGTEYMVLLAAPILANGLAEEFGIDVRSGRFSLLVLSIGSTHERSPLFGWRRTEVERFSKEVALPLETWAYQAVMQAAAEVVDADQG